MFKKNVCPFLKAPCLNQWCTKIITVRESASQVVVKNPPANAGDTGDIGLISGSRRSPKKGRATHSSIRARRIPWTEESGGSHWVPKSWARVKQLSMHEHAGMHETVQDNNIGKP